MSSTGVGASILAGSQANSTSGGLGAGIDISALVSASMANQTAELQVMQGQQTQLSSQQTALASFNNDLQTLQNTVFALTDPVGQLTQVAATSSNPSALTASAVSGTPTGEHTVAISGLATTASQYSNAVASSSTPIATGTLTIQMGSNTPVVVTIDSTNNTLDGLAQTINGTANIGVTASVITDANGARLAVVSNTSGTPGNLTITPAAGVLGFNQGVTGVNASLNVDGIPISSAANTVNGAIPGVTLSLASVTGGTPVTVTTGPDVTQQESALNAFVSAYNKVVGDLNTQFTVSSGTSQAGPLASDSTLSLAQGQILASAAFSMSGNGAVNSLSDLGVSMNNDGTLSVNSGAVASALKSNPSAVQSFFQADNAGSFGANLTSNLDTLANPITGAVAQDMNGLTQTQTSLSQQISDFQDQMNTMQQQLTQQYVQVDTTLQQLPLLLQQLDSQLTALG